LPWIAKEKAGQYVDRPNEEQKWPGEFDGRRFSQAGRGGTRIHLVVHVSKLGLAMGAKANHYRETKKKAAVWLPLAITATKRLRCVASTHGTCEAGAEFLDAASFDDAGLSARVEGMRLRRDITLEKWIGFAFVFDRFASVYRGAGDEL